MTYLKGIDISHWQGTTPSLAGLDFAAARASIGTTKDDKYDYHLANFKRAGIVTIAYHFNYDDNTLTGPANQARFFVATAGDVDLLALDVEGANAFEPAESRAFIAEVHRISTTPIGLYMSQSTFRDDGQDFDWIARWGSTPPAWSNRWEFWQYQGSPADLDYFNGDDADLQALKGDLMTFAAITNETPFEVTVAPNAPWYDLDGTTKIGQTGSLGLDWRISPFGVGTKRAIYATVGNVRRPVLLVPSASRTPAPVIDQGAITTAVTTATAPLTAQIADLKLAVAAAAGAERERIALAEATRIRGI